MRLCGFPSPAPQDMHGVNRLGAHKRNVALALPDQGYKSKSIGRRYCLIDRAGRHNFLGSTAIKKSSLNDIFKIIRCSTSQAKDSWYPGSISASDPGQLVCCSWLGRCAFRESWREWTASERRYFGLLVISHWLKLSSKMQKGIAFTPCKNAELLRWLPSPGGIHNGG